MTVNAATAEISAATLTVNAGMSTFSGVVQADTVITQLGHLGLLHAGRGEHLVSAHTVQWVSASPLWSNTLNGWL